MTSYLTLAHMSRDLGEFLSLVMWLVGKSLTLFLLRTFPSFLFPPLSFFFQEYRMEEKLYDAAYNGKEEEMRRILKENKNVNVNWKNQKDSGRTALFVACGNGRDKIVTMLLAHPDIDVNLKRNDGYHPFFIACENGNTVCVQLLLKDARVKVNEPRNSGNTPLQQVASNGTLGVTK